MRDSLGNHCTLKGGTGFPEALQGEREGELPFIKVSDMSLPGNERFITGANNYISGATAGHLGATVFPPQTIVFAKVGAALLLNRRRILTVPTVIDNNMMGATSTNANPLFLYHFLSSIDFGDFVQTGALPSVNQRILSAIQFPGFSGTEQKRIAEILSTVDEAIEQTEALIAKTQQIKAGLMHDLFTRGVTADGKLRPPREEAPNLYKESPLGWIPKEWAFPKVGECISGIDAGKSPECPDIPSANDQWGVLKVGAVHPDGLRQNENKVVLNPALYNVEYLLRDGDLLISRANTVDLVGLVCQVREAPPNLMLSDKTLRLRVSHGVADARYLFWVLQFHTTRLQIESFATGTSGSMKNISQVSVKALVVPLPGIQEQERIAERLDSLLQVSFCLKQELGKMNQLRNGLMHDLLTGRVPVTVAGAAEAEEAAADV